MQRLKFYFFTLILIPILSRGQQNFINVPSSEVTKKGQIFFQQQFNFNELVQANSTFDYGLGKGFETGFNILGLNYNQKGNSFFKNDTNDRDPYNPLIAFNMLKQFRLTAHSHLCMGGQLGANFRKEHRPKEAGLAYLNWSRSDLFGEHSQLVIGTYYNSMHYGGQGNRVGVWAGLQVPITHKFYAIGETVLGNNAISYTTLAAMYFPKKYLPLTLGLQIPNTSHNAYSIVFEITYVP